MSFDFLCEKKLAKNNPYYHELVRNTAFVMHNILDKYVTYFPTYTDHSSLHSLQVLDFCNHLIGSQIEKMNTDEIYILMMGCYLHDTGMGISDSDYMLLKDRIVSPEFKKENPYATIPEIIRSYHHEFSGGFIQKYADLFEIPSPAHTKAIIQVSRGHRKTDLLDENEYPIEYKLPNGNTVCLPYLSSLIRLADELDIARDRNVALDYNADEIKDNIEFKKHYAISHMEITEESFILTVETEDPHVKEAVKDGAAKLQETLDICRKATNERTPFVITQKNVEFIY